MVRERTTGPQFNNCRDSETDCILGPPSLKNPTSMEKKQFGRAAWRHPLTEHNKQGQATEGCQTSFELWLEECAMVRWDRNGTFWRYTPSTGLAAKDECKQGETPHTYCEIRRWVHLCLGDVFMQEILGHYLRWWPIYSRWPDKIPGHFVWLCPLGSWISQ